jgi:hypothetical protein
MPDTFVKIATVTVGSGGAATMAFSSIPSTYTDLCVKISARDSRTTNTANSLNLSFNGSSANFTCIFLEGQGVSPAISGSTSTGLIGISTTSTSTSNTFSNVEIYIPNYAGSSFKSISSDSVTEQNGITAYADLLATLWSNTAAITSVTLTPNGGFSFLQYSTATLYGISKT